MDATNRGCAQPDHLFDVLLCLASSSRPTSCWSIRTRYTPRWDTRGAASTICWRRPKGTLSTRNWVPARRAYPRARFGRGIAQLAGWIPLDIKTQLALRAEAGAVFASTSDGIPAPLLFRTGGDTTVRGYAFQSLGPRVGDATVVGRYYALAQC